MQSISPTAYHQQGADAWYKAMTGTDQKCLKLPFNRVKVLKGKWQKEYYMLRQNEVTNHFNTNPSRYLSANALVDHCPLHYATVFLPI